MERRGEERRRWSEERAAEGRGETEGEESTILTSFILEYAGCLFLSGDVFQLNTPIEEGTVLHSTSVKQPLVSLSFL